MRSQAFKNVYYATLGKVSVLSMYWYRYFRSAAFNDGYLNLGCGTKYVPGMINVDGNIFRQKDVWLDVTLGLPVPDSSVQGVYSSHLAEHLNGAKVRRLFSECYRVLKHGGALRIVVPSLEYAVQTYLQGSPALLPEWPDQYNSFGGRFNNFMLCRNQHLMMFDFSLLQELLSDAGFSNIVREHPEHSRYFKPEHMQFESDPALKDLSLYVEAEKR
jgi:predicted SAM-dependent methyltransferase